EKHRFPFVVHLAAQAGVRYSLEHPHAYVDANLEGFINVLEGCRYNDCKHLLFASSSSVYGANTKLPFSVQDNVDHPISLYAASKKANELMAHAYSHLYRLPATGLRFFTILATIILKSLCTSFRFLRKSWAARPLKRCCRCSRATCRQPMPMSKISCAILDTDPEPRFKMESRTLQNGIATITISDGRVQ